MTSNFFGNEPKTIPFFTLYQEKWSRLILNRSCGSHSQKQGSVVDYVKRAIGDGQ